MKTKLKWCTLEVKGIKERRIRVNTQTGWCTNAILLGQNWTAVKTVNHQSQPNPLCNDLLHLYFILMCKLKFIRRSPPYQHKEFYLFSVKLHFKGRYRDVEVHCIGQQLVSLPSGIYKVIRTLWITKVLTDIVQYVVLYIASTKNLQCCSGTNNLFLYTLLIHPLCKLNIFPLSRLVFLMLEHLGEGNSGRNNKPVYECVLHQVHITYMSRCLWRPLQSIILASPQQRKHMQ